MLILKLSGAQAEKLSPNMCDYPRFFFVEYLITYDPEIFTEEKTRNETSFVDSRRYINHVYRDDRR